MNNSRFSIFEASRNAYLFVGREWFYLLKAGVLPMAAQVAIALFLQYQRAEASRIESYLWGLPATVLFARFMFLETRLLLLGERADRLSSDVAARSEWRQALNLFVTLSLLFNMGMAMGFNLLLAASESGQWGVNWVLTLGGMAVTGALFWGLRFGVVPVLAAVRYPIRPFLRQVEGMAFSFRLLGMGIVTLFPVAFAFQLLIAAFIRLPESVEGGLQLTAAQNLGLLLISAPLSLATTALLNAAGIYALKQILGGRRTA